MFDLRRIHGKIPPIQRDLYHINPHISIPSVENFSRNKKQPPAPLLRVLNGEFTVKQNLHRMIGSVQVLFLLSRTSTDFSPHSV